MNKSFKVRDPGSGLWVAPDTQDLPGMTWTEEEEKAQTYQGQFWRDFWTRLGYEIVEVK